MNTPNEHNATESSFGLVSLSEPVMHFTGQMPPAPGHIFWLSKDDTNFIGRAAESLTICIKDATVARLHCQIEWSEASEEFQLTDIKVGNRTIVNGESTPPNKTVSIKHGDMISMGRIVFQLQQSNEDTTNDRSTTAE